MSEPIVDALLRSPEPSIRWKTRVEVLGESRGSRAARALQREIRASPRVRALLARRDASGRLSRPANPYSKWAGAHWVLAALADLGYPRGDRALLPVRDQLMEHWLGPEFTEEFTAETRAQAHRRRGVPVMQGRHRRCASQQGNALFAVVSLGLADDRAGDLVERLLHWQWPDGGWNCDRKPSASHSSFMESILPLRALGLVARETRDRAARRAALRAAEIFLKRDLFKRQRDGAVIRREFVELHYPLYWHYDVLHGLGVLAEVGLLGDPRCRDALDLLESRRLPGGGWPADRCYYRVKSGSGGPVDVVDWGGAGRRRTNEWVTVGALRVLREAGRIDP